MAGAFHFFLSSIHCYTLNMQLYRNHVIEILGNFKDPARVDLGDSEKEYYFVKIPKWQHKLVWNYKQGKLVSYLLNNAAKT